MSLWPLGQQRTPGMGDVVLQALLSFTPGMPSATGVLLGSALALGGQNPSGAVMGGTKCREKEELEWAVAVAVAASPDDAPTA